MEYYSIMHAEKFLNSGSSKEAQKAVCDRRHAVKDVLHLIGEAMEGSYINFSSQF